MITLAGVSKNFGNTRAVNQISFKVEEGETLVLLGTSGCGKTTTLKMINRLIEPGSGTICIDGRDIKQENPEELRRRIGYVLQNIGLFPHYTVAENIAVVAKLLKWGKEKILERTFELIEKLHLPDDCLNLFPHQLSGGQQQRIGLARALVTDPAILLMDEPFGALDNVTRSSIQAEFKALEEFKRKTIVMVTHDVQEAFELADRICLMNNGEIVQIGTPKDLLYKPVDDFARRFLDGHRLALEFKVITIQDIWEFLPDASPERTENVLSAEMDVWSAMERLNSAASDESPDYLHPHTGQTKGITFKVLSSAFHSYQNSKRND
ncbi:osmoprotectant transport system ATP-binding protein [Pedobacter sp. AK017]|uniref:ABC transporter ATP-binding protein n=1 Tax=Pedobacter sp. AK017 TaxID=2723073 RepID=UPI00161E762B|nr:ATP-binding cassette domain-containing protein [Pedobacter sp. AK017]MBB5438096.1 osmoprotectant transport system ATP-binding protein [Pedobacter sp. AK017]